MEARENTFQISQELKNTGKIVMHKISFCEVWISLKFVFTGSRKNLSFGVISHNLLRL